MTDTTGHAPTITVAPPPPQEVPVDRLSDLPEPLILKILSFLPTHMAAQTSCLSRHFRHLWSASPSLYFNRRSFSVTAWFVKMVDRAFLSRDSSARLESLRIKSSYDSRCLLPLQSVERWIVHAGYLRVRHLHLILEVDTVLELCRHIFFIRSLESLHIETLYFTGHKVLMPIVIGSTRLKSLCLWLNMTSARLTRLIRGLPVLEYLELRGIDQIAINISSLSVRTLKLQCCSSKRMKLCFPKLDFIQLICEVNNLKMFKGEMPLVSKAEFDLESPIEVPTHVLGSMLNSVANAVELNLSIDKHKQFGNIHLRCCEMQLPFSRLEYLEFECRMCFLNLVQAEMPVLRKADICISYAKEEFASSVSEFLKCIANVIDLQLTIWEHESNKKRPLFPCLINFELSTCCHEATIEDVISLLDNSPVLNCLKMNHRDPYTCGNQDKKKRDWQSKLPRNSEGNFQHACFTDLHIREEKSHVIKLLSRRLTSKKRKIR